MTTLVHVNLGSNLKLLHEGACDEMKSVAEHSTLELTEKLQSKVHYTLSYIESEDKQVILRERGEGEPYYKKYLINELIIWFIP